jgi:hypothetical protein
MTTDKGTRRQLRCLAGHWRQGLVPAVFVAICAAAGGCQSGRASTGTVSFQTEPWSYGPWQGRKLTTRHYEVYTTVNDPVLVETFPGLLERCYEYYQELVPPAREPAEPMKVYLMATRSQWAALTRQLTGPRAVVFLKIRNGGFSDGGVSVIQYVTHAVTFPLLAHEGFHQYLHTCVDPAVPAWLNEGLAVVCEGQRWTGSGLKSFDRWYNPVRRNQLAEALARQRLLSLEELLSTHAGEIVDEPPTRIATYYAQVWGLMLFLWEGQDGKYAGGFARLRQALRDPELTSRLRAEQIWSSPEVSPGRALFQSFITEDLEAFEREYVSFLRNRILSERGPGSQRWRWFRPAARQETSHASDHSVR